MKIKLFKFLGIIIFFIIFEFEIADAQCADSDIACVSEGNMLTEPYQSPIGNIPSVISWPLAKAYPGIEYNVRMGVVGGKYPYTFSLREAPNGMLINEETGEISWTPDIGIEGQSFLVDVLVRDQLNNETYQNFSINVTKSGFYFVSPAGNDLTGDGSIDFPWRSIDYAISMGSVDNILYARGGEYPGQIGVASGNINKWIAYPGEQPVIDTQLSIISPRDNYGLIDGFEIKNSRRWGFSFNGQTNYIFRRNNMHHLYDDSVAENPSFIFFWDGSKNHKNHIIQDNVFHDLFDRGSGINGDNSANYHGSSTVMYDVKDSLVEDNLIYNIDGNGIHDKDNSLRNVHRGNFIYDVHDAGIAISNQYYSYNVEISHNVIKSQLRVGGQPQSIGNISVHNNTIIGIINHNSGTPVGMENSMQFFNNIIYDNSSEYVYKCCNSIDGGLYASNLIFRDYNLIYTNDSFVCGLLWGGDNRFTLSEWIIKGFDINSILADPLFLDVDNMDYRLSENSLACSGGHEYGYIGAFDCDDYVLNPPGPPTGLSVL